MNPEFEIIETHSYRIMRFGEPVVELTENQRHLLKQVAQGERIAGIKLLRSISRLLPNDPWGLKCCRDMLDAMQADLAD